MLDDPVRLSMLVENPGLAAGMREDSLSLAKGIAICVFAVFTVILAAEFTIFIWPHARAGSWIGVIALSAIALAIAATAFWMREIKKVQAYPFIEIAIGLGIATQVARHTDDPVVVLIGFVGAVRLIIEGLKRINDRRAQANSASTLA